MQLNAQAQKKQNDVVFNFFLAMMYTAAITVLLYYLYDGLSFYLTPFIERAHHEDYRNLRPAGFRGHGLGILGTAMILLLFLYSARKRFRVFQKFGRVSRWLNIHIFFGIMGPLFIILHSTFKVNGLISVSFWSMIAVALSGVLGRYLYLKIPHNILGRQLSYDELNQKKMILNRHLKKKYHIPEKLLSQIEQITERRDMETRSTLAVIFYLIKEDLTRRSRLRKLIEEYSAELSLESDDLQYFIKIILLKAKMDSETFFWKRIHSLFHYWHVIHKPFAYIMLLIMVVHVVVAVMMGYTWL
ncbi:MAG: hypothetical protein DWQ05_14855 [Calditrichaeota bacterium]|nr:MAG: hypothetical protein DWQ05_14855 [Calditrichota bacterium]